jgi:hypothetical protein
MTCAAADRVQLALACIMVAGTAAASMVVGCGGSTSAARDAGALDAGPAPLGPDGCASESGYLICGGTHDCPTHSDACLYCISDPGNVGLCGTTATTGPGICPLCDDGNVCIRVVEQAPYQCLPFDVGQLFAENGSADRVRYTDWSAWTGQALPRPADCGDGGLPLCGGLCSPCPKGSTCTGRSPLHPYGFCVPSSWNDCTRSAPNCDSGNRCFIFTDAPDAQAVADQYGLCLPTAECQALAAGYPGGGACVP